MKVAESISRYPVVLRRGLPGNVISSLIDLVDEMMELKIPRAPRRAYRLLTDMLDLGRADLVDRLVRAAWCAPLPDVARKLLTDDPVLLITHCIVRRYQQGVSPPASPWHVDAEFLGFDQPVINFWTPLVDVGEMVPGLSFTSDRREGGYAFGTWLESVQPTESSCDTQAFQRGRAVLQERLAPAALISPVVSAGDTLLFDQVIPHKTQEMFGAPGVRYSVEMRVAGRQHLPSGYLGSVKRIALVPDGFWEGGHGLQVIRACDMIG